MESSFGEEAHGARRKHTACKLSGDMRKHERAAHDPQNVQSLGEIEVLLGLPEGFRVSDVGDGAARECGDILTGQNGGTSFLVRAIMMGAGTPVKGIGETLERLKKALEGRIQV